VVIIERESSVLCFVVILIVAFCVALLNIALYPYTPCWCVMSQDSESEEKSKSASQPKLGPSPSGSKVVAPSPRTCTAMAHNKMTLHALKHLTCTPVGILIGYAVDSKTSSFVHVMDAIPLYHNYFSAMLVEVAFMQVEAWLETLNKHNAATEQPLLEIVGTYFANAKQANSELNTAAVVIAEQLANKLGKRSVVIGQVMNERIQAAFDGRKDCVNWYMLKSGTYNQWKPADDVYIVRSKQYVVLQDMVVKNLPSLPLDDLRSGAAKWTKKDYKKLTHQLMQCGTAGINEAVYSKPEVMSQYERFVCSMSALEMIVFKDLGLGALVHNKRDEIIFDFEEHLDDITKDWRNVHCC